MKTNEEVYLKGFYTSRMLRSHLRKEDNLKNWIVAGLTLIVAVLCFTCGFFFSEDVHHPKTQEEIEVYNSYHQAKFR